MARRTKARWPPEGAPHACLACPCNSCAPKCAAGVGALNALPAMVRSPKAHVVF